MGACVHEYCGHLPAGASGRQPDGRPAAGPRRAEHPRGGGRGPGLRGLGLQLFFRQDGAAGRNSGGDLDADSVRAGGGGARDGFAAYVHWLFHRIQSGAGEYPGFFQGHAAGFLPEGRSAGRRTMAEALGRVRQTLLEALEADCAVRPSAFDASFSREQLAAFVLDSLLGQMSRGADNCEGLEQVLRRLLYR